MASVEWTSKYFTRAEFACKCGCGFDDIDPQLVALLDQLRELYGSPIKIDSGCRCEARNKAVGGEPNSAHLRGKAADIETSNSGARYMVTSDAFKVGFKRIGQYKTSTIVHVDIDSTLPQFVMWVH